MLKVPVYRMQNEKSKATRIGSCSIDKVLKYTCTSFSPLVIYADFSFNLLYHHKNTTIKIN